MLIAHWLGPAGKGQVFLVTQLASLASLFLSMGLNTSYLYHLRKGSTELKETVSHASIVISVYALAALGINQFGMPWLRRLTGFSLSDKMISLMLVLALLNIATLLFGSILMDKPKGVQLTSMYSIGRNLLYVLLLVAVAAWFRLDTYDVILAAGLSYVVRLYLTIRSVLHGTRLKLSLHALKWTKTFLAYGLGSFAGSLMMTSVFRIDTFIVNSISGAAQLGIYSVAVTLAEMLLMFPSAIGTALFPHLTAQAADRRLITACFVARLSVLVGFASSLFMILVSYQVILIVFGRAFLPAYVPFLCLLPGLIAMTVSYGYANFFSSQGKPSMNAMIFCCGMVADVAIDLVVVPRYGITGAAVVSTLSYLIVAGLFMLAIRRMGKVAWKDLILPNRGDILYIWNRISVFRDRRRFD